jgi:hypothetical protein
VITLTSQTRPRSTAGTLPSRVTGAVAHAAGRGNGPTLVAVRDGLWRVVDRTGAVIGHIERQAHSDGDRYLARRIVMATRRIELGAFWRMDDAADCFR